MANWLDNLSKKKTPERYDVDNDDNFNNDGYYANDPYQNQEKENEQMDDRHIGSNNRGGYSTRRAPDDYMAPEPARKSSVNLGGRPDSCISMSLMKPVKYLECQDIADKLIAGGAVIMNLENADKETASNLIYFLSGVLYALEGHIKSVSADTYMLTPGNMEITDETSGGSEETDFNEDYNG